MSVKLHTCGAAEKWWRSGESARLLLMCPGFDSRTRRLMWVGFGVGSLPCSERFFSGYSGFPLSSKTNISKFQFELELSSTYEPLARVIAQALSVFDIKFAFTFTFFAFTFTLRSWKVTKCDLMVTRTRQHRARLVSSNRECFAHYKHISYFFILQSTISLPAALRCLDGWARISSALSSGMCRESCPVCWDQLLSPSTFQLRTTAQTGHPRSGCATWFSGWICLTSRCSEVWWMQFLLVLVTSWCLLLRRWVCQALNLGTRRIPHLPPPFLSWYNPWICGSS